jgi:hypothetical protein
MGHLTLFIFTIAVEFELHDACFNTVIFFFYNTLILGSVWSNIRVIKANIFLFEFKVGNVLNGKMDKIPFKYFGLLIGNNLVFCQFGTF